MQDDSLKKPFAPKFFLILGLVICASAVYLLLPSWRYYMAPPGQRAISPQHSVLRSSGTYGLGFGALGAALMLINLTYLLRKRLSSWQWLGHLKSWMAFHVFTGLVAGAMVLLHSTFLLRSALGTLAFWSMTIVLLTGLIGRFIYAHTPRSLKGSELEREEIERNLGQYRQRLEKLGMPTQFFDHVQKPAIYGSDKGLFGSLRTIVVGDRELRKDQTALRDLVSQTPSLRTLSREILPLADRYCQERQWMSRYQELRSLMGGWRFLHRWIAIFLIVAVIFHIGVAFQMSRERIVKSFSDLRTTRLR